MDEVLQKQHDLQQQQAKLLVKLNEKTDSINDKLDFILVFLKIKATDERAVKWRSQAKSPPLDTLGNMLIGGEWLKTKINCMVGETWKWLGNDSVLIRTEWDLRPKRE